MRENDKSTDQMQWGRHTVMFSGDGFPGYFACSMLFNCPIVVSLEHSISKVSFKGRLGFLNANRIAADFD